MPALGLSWPLGFLVIAWHLALGGRSQNTTTPGLVIVSGNGHAERSGQEPEWMSGRYPGLAKM